MGSRPVAGLTGHYLQYVLGLRDLGHDVLYVEDTGWYYDPWTRTYRDEWRKGGDAKATWPPKFIAGVMEAHGLGDRWSWVDIGGERFGLTGGGLKDFLATADLF